LAKSVSEDKSIFLKNALIPVQMANGLSLLHVAQAERV
jgi:hypothetical protein